MGLAEAVCTGASPCPVTFLHPFACQYGSVFKRLRVSVSWPCPHGLMDTRVNGGAKCRTGAGDLSERDVRDPLGPWAWCPIVRLLSIDSGKTRPSCGGTSTFML